MTNLEIKQVLIKKGVRYLYHANTVETSLSFLQSRGLLSRGLCEDMKLPQTGQYTDDFDKRYNIFYDIFFDSMEIQKRTGVSYYGPVLFVYDIDVLDTVEEGHIRITKMNPDKWKNTISANERYFLKLEELSLFFDKGNFGQHITLTNKKNILSFEYLEKIVLSDPQQKDNLLFEVAKARIRGLIDDACLAVPFIIRDYGYNNRFHDTYANPRKLQEHFRLGGHK